MVKNHLLSLMLLFYSIHSTRYSVGSWKCLQSFDHAFKPVREVQDSVLHYIHKEQCVLLRKYGGGGGEEVTFSKKKVMGVSQEEN